MRNSKVRAPNYSFSKITTAANAFRDLLGQSQAQSAAISYQARPVSRTSATWPDLDGTGFDSHRMPSLSATNTVISRMPECRFQASVCLNDPEL